MNELKTSKYNAMTVGTFDRIWYKNLLLGINM